MRVDASAERLRAEKLLADEAARKRRQRAEWDETPRSTGTGMADDSVYGDAYNRDALREAREARRRWRGRGEDVARFSRDRSRERDRYWGSSSARR